MNSISEFLDLEDSDIFISSTHIEGLRKFITVESRPSPHYCPSCGFRMHSKGITKRTINHPILQDHYSLTIILKQRRWRCSNKDCRFEANDSFRFVGKNRRNTNVSDMLIVLAFKDLFASASEIARRYNTSDAHVFDIFDRYVRLDRLPLSDIISVDEVHLELDQYCKYALVIQDFYTGDPIDLLRSRRSDVTEPYFTSIPTDERNAVRYLISDMYNPYIDYVRKYFPNAVPVVDSFHVIQWIVRAIDNYIRELLRRFKRRDLLNEEQRSRELGYPVHLPISHEVYLLTKYRWLILSNQNSLTYHIDPRMDKHFRSLMNTYDYERHIFAIDPRLKTLRSLKELYVQFNIQYSGDPIGASVRLSELIDFYRNGKDPIFIDFARLLDQYRDPIINSFIMTQKNGPGGIYDSRLSNGPIESLNRKIKDLRRLGRGFRNFEHFRNRFLYATRNRPVLNGTAQLELPEGWDDAEID